MSLPGIPKFNPHPYRLEQSQPLPSASQFSSPLKRTKEAAAALSLMNLAAKKRKLTEKISIKVLTLSGRDAEYWETLPAFLKPQAQAIELCMQARPMTSDNQEHVRAIICAVASNEELSEVRKLAELGVLYYHLAQDQFDLIEQRPSSLFALRLVDIEEKALELKAIHKQMCPKHLRKTLPSGAVAYLVRVFAWMIFPHDGGFNLGGCFAVKELLQTRLNLHLTEEMRMQILRVVDRLIVDLRFRQLFQKPFPVHPDMQILINIDIHVPLDDPMNFVYVRWALLTALFSMMCQLNEANCFAVSIGMNVLSTHCDLLLHFLIEVLTTGKIDCEWHSIPVGLLFLRKEQADFLVEINPAQARHLTGFAVAQAALSQDSTSEEEAEPSTPMPLGHILQAEFSEFTWTAKKIFLALKQSHLQKLLISAVQFFATNSMSLPGRGSISPKGCLLSACENNFSDYLERKFKDSLQLLPWINPVVKRLAEKFDQIFFFLDYPPQQYGEDQGKVTFQYHTQGLILQGDLKRYAAFKEMRRLFYYSPDGFCPVDSLSLFTKICAHELENLDISSSSQAVWVKDKLLTFLKSEDFKKGIAKWLAISNKNVAALPWNHYYQSDSFFVIQDGGDPAIGVKFPYLEERFAAPETITGRNPGEFFMALCRTLQKIHCGPGDQVLVHSLKHAFNISPYDFREYWNQPNIELIKQIISPALALLQRGIRSEEFDYAHFKGFLPRILTRLGLDLSPTQLAEVESYMGASKKVRDLLNPALAAHVLQKGLIACSASTFRTRLILEKAIRKELDLPQIIQLGNLNWVDAFSEKLQFSYLILKYDLQQEKLVFARRTGCQDHALPNEMQSLHGSLKLFPQSQD